MPRHPVSDHCDGDRFFNVDPSADRSFAQVVRWMRTRVRTPWPPRATAGGYPPPPASVETGHAAITFIGHSTFLVRTASTVILTDPVFTTHAGPFGWLGPPRVRPPGLDAAALPPVDLVLVSHNHYDHLQPSSLRLFRRAAFVAPLGVSTQLGLERTSRELDWWQTEKVGEAEVTAIPAQHFSARTPWDRNRTLWCGYIVQSGGITLCFAGDTGYAAHFAQVAARCPRIDVALLPIGAYEPRWFMTPMHMNPEDAVRAHRDLGPRVSIGMHFGTFQLTDEGIDDPVTALARARAAAGLAAEDFRVLGFGETVVI